MSMSGWSFPVILSTVSLVLTLAGWSPAYGRNVSGTVKNVQGEPIGGAKVTVSGVDPSSDLLVERSATTDAGGTFLVEGAPTAALFISAEALGFKKQLGVETEREGDVTANFKLEHAGHLSFPDIANFSLHTDGSAKIIQLDPRPGLVEVSSAICANTLVNATVHRIDDQNIGGIQIFDISDPFNPIPLHNVPQVGDPGIFNINAVCIDGQPGIVANFPAGTTRGLGVAEPPEWEPDIFATGPFQNVHVDRDSASVGAYSPEGRGQYRVFDIVSRQQKYVFEPQNGTGVLWNEIQGAPKPIHMKNVVLGALQFIASSNPTVTALNSDSTIQWQSRLFSDAPPPGPNPHTATAMIRDGDRIYVFVSNIAARCNEIYILDARTGQLQGKPRVLDTILPANRRHDKHLAPAGGGAIAALDFNHIDQFQIQLTVFNPDSQGFTTLPLPSGDVSGPVADFVGTDSFTYYISYSGGSLDLLTLTLSAAPLIFAQFADGDGLFSQITLSNPSLFAPVTAELHFRDPQGNNLRFDAEDRRITLPGNTFEGILPVTIPRGGQVSFETDGAGPVVVGTVVVTSSQRLSGSVIFGGTIGLAGVLGGQILTEGFLAPIEVDAQKGINTGVAIVNLEEKQVTRRLFLFSDGNYLATAEVTLPAHGQRALFVEEFSWDAPVDFQDFNGILILSGEGLASAVVIQTRPGQFATVPVTPWP